jgi:hypothetical protein
VATLAEQEEMVVVKAAKEAMEVTAARVVAASGEVKVEVAKEAAEWVLDSVAMAAAGCILALRLCSFVGNEPRPNLAARQSSATIRPNHGTFPCFGTSCKLAFP